MLRYMPEAIPTAIGWAHPITGEQLTAESGLADPVDNYKPNGGRRAFVDPESEDEILINTISRGNLVTFSIQMIDDIENVTNVHIDLNGAGEVDFGKKLIIDMISDEPGINTAAIRIEFDAAGSGEREDAEFEIEFITEPTGSVPLFDEESGSIAEENTANARVNVFNAGTGYTSAPLVFLPGAPALFAVLSGDGVDSVTVVDGSTTGAASGTFGTVPTITFTGGGGTGAAGTVVLNAGVIESVTITNAGSGYTSAPTITISDGTPSTTLMYVRASAEIEGDGVSIVRVEGETPAGYVDAYNEASVTFNGGGGTGATGEVSYRKLFTLTPPTILSIQVPVTVTYQWLDDETELEDETGLTMLIPDGIGTSDIKVEVTATNKNGSEILIIEGS